MIKTPVTNALIEFAINIQNIVLLSNEPIPEQMLEDLAGQYDYEITIQGARVVRLHKELTGEEY